MNAKIYKAPVANPAYERTVTILREKGYNRIDEFKRSRISGCALPELHFEIWAGDKGVMILQVWKDGHGVHTYADWGHGKNFNELKAAL